MTKPLVLASASPRRKELLSKEGIEIEVVPSNLEENLFPGEGPEDFALRVAQEKALFVAFKHPGQWVLGADTIVVVPVEAGRVVLGKPADSEEAIGMLQTLSGKTHEVITAVALVQVVLTPPYEQGQGLVHRVRSESFHVTTEVAFRDLSDREIRDYVATGEPMDKAGAYGIQGLGGNLVAAVQGSYTNVVGLPVEEVLSRLRSLKIL
jgi:septum formation protein